MTDSIDVQFSSSIGFGYIGILNFINTWHSPSLSLVVSRIMVFSNLWSSSTTGYYLRSPPANTKFSSFLQGLSLHLPIIE
uniref:Uncharacterized protein n=1 Tax=Arundo donax TaxID=35708 RepID=A0A0A9B5S7_ARUDO